MGTHFVDKDNATRILTEYANSIKSKSDLLDLAPAFDTTVSYSVGDYVTYQGDVYRFTSNHSAGAWASADVTKVDIGAELKSKVGTSALDGKADLSDLAADFSTSVSYVQGDYVNYNGDIYKFTSNHTAGAWIGSDATLVIITTELKNPVQWTTL